METGRAAAESEVEKVASGDVHEKRQDNELNRGRQREQSVHTNRDTRRDKNWVGENTDG